MFSHPRSSNCQSLNNTNNNNPYNKPNIILRRANSRFGTGYCIERMSSRQMDNTSSGTLRMSRNTRRMMEYNQRKMDANFHPDRYEKVEVQHRNQEAMSCPSEVNSAHVERQKNRTALWRERQKPLPKSRKPAEQWQSLDEDKFRAEVNVPGQVSPMYSAGPIFGSIPINHIYAQNLDHSTFPLLVECTYRDLQAVNDRLQRRMPYCAFLHACTVALNAVLIDIQQNENLEGDLRAEGDVGGYLDQMQLPGPILEYLSKLGQTVTATGETVSMNVPAAAVPSNDAGHVGGTYGRITAENHNLYECYVAPRVTRRRIEAALANEQDWSPIDPELLPQGFRPTANFLGYGEVDFLHADARCVLQGVEFPGDISSEGLRTRLQYSPQVTALVNDVLESLPIRYKIGPARVTRKRVTGFVGFIEVTTTNSSNSRLTDYSATLFSSESMGACLGNMTYLLGLKRRRSAEAPGFCGLDSNGVPYPDWMATRNLNFECQRVFAIRQGVDCPKLRHAEHRAVPSTGSRLIDIVRFIERNYRM